MLNKLQDFFDITGIDPQIIESCTIGELPGMVSWSQDDLNISGQVQFELVGNKVELIALENIEVNSVWIEGDISVNDDEFLIKTFAKQVKTELDKSQLKSISILKP